MRLAVTRGSKRLVQPGILQNAIGRMPHLDPAIEHEAAAGDRTEPNFVIALAHANEMASGVQQQSFDLPSIAPRHGSGGSDR